MQCFKLSFCVIPFIHWCMICCEWFVKVSQIKKRKIDWLSMSILLFKFIQSICNCSILWLFILCQHWSVRHKVLIADELSMLTEIKRRSIVGHKFYSHAFVIIQSASKTSRPCFNSVKYNFIVIDTMCRFFSHSVTEHSSSTQSTFYVLQHFITALASFQT